MSKRYISFSLWGDSRLYCQGAIDNIKLAKEVYPDFTCRFYVAEDCPALADLRNLDCEIVVMPKQKGIDRENKDWTWQFEHIGMFWRYLIIDELVDGDIALFRDCDSRVSKRESDIVYKWIDSDKIALVFAENAAHRNSFTMSGMFSIKGGILIGIKESIYKWIERYKEFNHPWIFVDLEYNSNILAPLIGQHTLYYGYGFNNSLPPLKDGEKFIGEVINGEWRNEKYIPVRERLKDIFISPEAIQEIRKYND